MFISQVASLFLLSLVSAKLQEPQGQVVINAVKKEQAKQQPKPEDQEKGLSSENAYRHHSINEHQPPQGFRVDPQQPGIYKFDFTNRRADAFQYFSLTVGCEERVAVEAWDCFCTGDSFEVFNGSQSLFTTEGVFDLKCRKHDSNPGYCYSNSGSDSWSYGYTELEEGEYVIRISNINTPYVSGSAFISFKALCYNEEYEYWYYCCSDEDNCDNNTILNKRRHQPHWDCHECHKDDHGCDGKKNF